MKLQLPALRPSGLQTLRTSPCSWLRSAQQASWPHTRAGKRIDPIDQGFVQEPAKFVMAARLQADTKPEASITDLTLLFEPGRRQLESGHEGLQWRDERLAMPTSSAATPRQAQREGKRFFRCFGKHTLTPVRDVQFDA